MKIRMEVRAVAKVNVNLEAVLRVAERAVEARMDGPGASVYEVEFNDETGTARIYQLGARGGRVSVEEVDTCG